MRSVFLVLSVWVVFVVPVNGQVATQTTASKDTLLKDPDTTLERQKIINYFNTHQNQTVFTTNDRTYADWWGMWASSVNSVFAGHLLNKKQTYAVLYYVLQENQAALVVYLKAKAGWRAILTDTSLTDDLGLSFEDWNGDGIKDILLRYNPGRNTMEDKNYTLYLTDSTGTKLHLVKDFEELRSPAIDSPSGHIITQNSYRETETFEEYVFRGYQLKRVVEIAVREDWSKMDGGRTIEFSKNGRVFKTLQPNGRSLRKFIPYKFWKRSMDNYDHWPANRKAP